MTVIMTFRLSNKQRSSLNMLLEFPCTTFHLLTILIFALSVTISKLFAIETCVTLTLTFRMANGEIFQLKDQMRLPVCSQWKCLSYLYTIAR